MLLIITSGSKESAAGLGLFITIPGPTGIPLLHEEGIKGWSLMRRFSPPARLLGPGGGNATSLGVIHSQHLVG